MAYNDSGELSPSESYQLGGYTFELRSNYDGDEEVTGIVARMTYNGEIKIGGIDVDGQATIEGWSVEANETEASVYAKVKTMEDGDERTSDLDTGNATQPIPVGDNVSVIYGWYPYKEHQEARPWMATSCSGVYVTSFVNNSGSTFSLVALWAGKSEGLLGKFLAQNLVAGNSNTKDIMSTREYTHNGKTVYFDIDSSVSAGETISVDGPVIAPAVDAGNTNFTRAGEVAWTIVYGSKSGGDSNVEEKLIARFAIDLRDADPEDWDEPGDTGEPSKTLHVNVIGTSPGNAAGVPLEAEAATVYGSGGKGGNGGGGGAGASTVIIYEFTTDKAGSVEQEAYTRGYGIGGSGGKGGSGGDGCILIFY